jgi:hypothetical protein
MSLRILFLVLPFAIATIAWADPPSRPDLNGKWRLNPSLSEVHSQLPSDFTWRIEQSDSAIHLVQQGQEGKQSGDIRCATDGKDCKIKDEGHSATVSFYYNGPVLVELETEGQSAVTKKRMQVSSDGTTLTVNVIHIVPADKPQEKLVLTRETTTAGR